MKPAEKPLILIIDDESINANILVNVLVPEYRLIVGLNGQQGLELAEQQKPQLILLDVSMPKMDGHEVCRQLKNNALTHSIPIIFITSHDNLDEEAEGFDLGAVDYISRLTHPKIINRRIATHLSLIRTEEVDSLARSAIQMLGEAGHYNDNDTGVHIWRMAAYSMALAKLCDWPAQRIKQLELAASMHDTGKVGISDNILKAPRALTADEWDIMKTHAQIGHDILSMSNNPVFQLAAEVALCHHERFDGTGYPHKLRGDEIPQSAQIVAIADVFDALTMKRPYKEAWPLDAAFDEIKNLSGSHFSPLLVDKFLTIKHDIKNIKDEWDMREQCDE